MKDWADRVIEWAFWTLWALTVILAIGILTGCQSPPPPQGAIDPRVYLPSGQIIDPRTVNQPGLVIYQSKF